MDDQKLRIYNAIGSFVQDLNTGFGKKYKPVALYNRLIEKTTLRDEIAITRHINAFKTFFEKNAGYIKNKTLSNDAKIIYSDRIYLDIGRILSKTDKETHQYIHKHLITIYTLLNIGTKAGKQALETLKEQEASSAKKASSGVPLDIIPNTNEGAFIKDTLTEMTQQFENMGDDTNPMQMMTTMMQSGFFTKFMGDMQNKMSSGEMDLRSLMGTVTSIITEVAPDSGAEADQLKNFVGQSMSQMSLLTGGEEAPNEVQDHMNSLLDAIGGKSTKALNVLEAVNDADELDEEDDVVQDDGAEAKGEDTVQGDVKDGGDDAVADDADVDDDDGNIKKLSDVIKD